MLAEPGDTLMSDLEMGIAEAVRIELLPLKNKTDQLIDGVDDILENLKAVFEADATLGLPTAFESIQRTVESLEKTSIQLDNMVAENRSALNGIMTNVEGITSNIKDHNDELANVMENFSEISDSLAAVNFAETVNRANSALTHVDEITRKINMGEGSLGQLVNSDSLHDGLIATNNELQYLINDLYLNPWRYVRVSVFGKKQEKALSKKELKKLKAIIEQQLDEREENQQP
jgi:phospholipid/cholesterol/gamma-HCH transport system substrate-binding protein